MNLFHKLSEAPDLEQGAALAGKAGYMLPGCTYTKTMCL